jgi:hypothetical protein
MRLLILRQTSIAGQPARVGDVVEVSDRDARLLINSKKAMMQDPEPVQPPRKPRTRSKANGHP